MLCRPQKSKSRDIQAKTINGKRVVAYFIQWGIYARGFKATDIPIEKVTHLNYAFARISRDGQFTVQIADSYADTQYMYPGMSWNSPAGTINGNFGYINRILKERNPNFVSLISIGGWTFSDNFSTMAASETSRKMFATSCAQFVEQYGFQGVDLDWEYPVEGGLASNAYSPADGVSYTLVCLEIRSALNALSAKTGVRYELTIAAPANPKLIKHLEVDKLAAVLDFINVMTYDYRGSWSPFTGHQTPLYPSLQDPFTELGCTTIAVDAFLNAGCPADKLLIGAAMYGRGFIGVPNTNNGLYQKYTAVPMGTWDALGGEGATGVFDYKDIVGKNMPKYYDTEVQAPWVYDPNQQGGLMISYDDVQSIKAKVSYLFSKGLGGIMFWELSGDIRSGTAGSLLDTAVEAIKEGQSSSPPVVTPPPVTPPVVTPPVVIPPVNPPVANPPVVTPPVVNPPVVTPPVVNPPVIPPVVTPPVVTPPVTPTNPYGNGNSGSGSFQNDQVGGIFGTIGGILGGLFPGTANGSSSSTQTSNKPTSGGSLQTGQNVGGNAQGGGSTSTANKAFNIVAYYTNFSALAGYTLDKVPFDQITHLNYAYASVNADATVAFSNEMADTQLPYGQVRGGVMYLNTVAKSKYPNLKTLLSFGGYSGSANFPAALNQVDKLASGIVNLALGNGFDGVDMCYEWPGDQGTTSGNQGQDLALYGQLIAKLCQLLNSSSQGRGSSCILTMSAPGDARRTTNLSLTQFVPYVKWFNLHSFELVSATFGKTGHVAPLNSVNTNQTTSVKQSVEGWLNKNIPADKLSLGISYHAQVWTGVVAGSQNGLWQTVTQANIPVPTAEQDPGVGLVPTLGQYSFRYVNSMLNMKKVQSFYDETAQATYAYGMKTNVFASYENARSVDAKCSFVVSAGLAGASIYEISSDSLDNELTYTLHADLVQGAPLPGTGDGGSNGNPPVPQPTSKALVGYYLSQTGAAPLNFALSNVKIESMSHLIYGGASVSTSNQIVWANPQIDASNMSVISTTLKPRNANAKFILSLSDSGTNTGLSSAIQSNNSAALKTIAQQAAQFMSANNFDGAYVEYRWPTSPAHGQALATFLGQLRSAAGQKIVTVLLPWVSTLPNLPSSSMYFPIAAMAKSVDFFMVQTYDFVAPGTPPSSYTLTGLGSNIKNNLTFDALRYTSVEATVVNYINQGVSSSKFIISAPLFGRAFDGVPDTWQNGLYIFYSKLGQGATGYGSNVIPYYQVRQQIGSGKLKEFYDAQAMDSYAYGTSLSTVPGSGYYVTYDDDQAISDKAKYILSSKLGGLMLWELSGDPNGDLISVAAKGLK